MRNSPGTITTCTTTTRRGGNNGVFGHGHSMALTKEEGANTISFVTSNGVVSGVDDCGLKASVCLASHLPSLPFVIIIASALCFYYQHTSIFWRYYGLDRRLRRCTVMTRFASVLLLILFATNVTTTILQKHELPE
jgi:hypothetical protein